MIEHPYMTWSNSLNWVIKWMRGEGKTDVEILKFLTGAVEVKLKGEGNQFLIEGKEIVGELNGKQEGKKKIS